MAIQSTVRIYAVTLAALAAALLLRWLLDPWLGDHLALATLYGAVALAVWVGGLRPAILSILLGYLVCDWLFIAPRGQFDFTPLSNLIGLILYLLSCATIIFLGDAVREARRRAEASLAQVEEEITQRKQAEQTLLASQRRLQLVSDHMPALISYVDREGYYRFNNARYEEWFGIQAEQINGRQMRDLLGEAIYEQRLPFIERALAGEVVRFEGPTRHQQLGVRDTQLTYVPNTDEHGTVQGFYVMAQDVTERKQTEERYHGLFTAMQEGFLLSELIEAGSEQRIDFRYLDVNPAAERMLGLKREQIVGKSARAIIPAVREELLQQYAQVARTGEPLRHEVFEPMLNQYHENFAFCPAPGQVAILFWEITERKLAEEALRESEERFRLATNAGSVGVWDWDIVSNRISWSDSLYAIHGLKSDEFAGTVEAFAELIHPDDRAFVNEAIQRTLQEGMPYELEFRAMRPAGTLIWISTQAQVMRDAAGRPQRLLGGTVDVTRRKQAELALRKSEEQQAFLLKLSDQLRTLADPADIQYEAARILGEHLGADRVGYAEDQGEGETLVVIRNFTAGVPSIEGRHRYADYGATLLTECQAGRTVVQPDIANDPALTDAEKTAHMTLQIGASVNVPLVKAGRLAAILFVHCHAAHAWSPNEVTLMQETAERLWIAVERARAEAAVRTSEARFRQVFDEAPVGMVQAELNGRLQQVNPAICALFGRPAEELIGRHPDELTPPEYHAGDRDYFRRVVQGGASQPALEKEFLRGDGSRVWGQLTATLVRDAVGKPSYYIVIIENITVRKQVAETLRASEERYRNLLTSIDQGFCVFEMLYDTAGQAVDYRFLEVNPTFERHTGLKDAVGKTAKELVPQLEAHWIETYGHVAATGEARRFEQGSLEMGRLFDVEAARVGGNQSHKVALLFRDITESRRAEERLRESEARFRNMADHAPVMIWVTEADWSCTYLSQSWYEFTGQNPEIGLGFGWLQAVHPDDQQIAHDAFVNANAGETEFRIEYRLQRQDGTYAWVLDSARPRLSASGEFLGYIGSVTDISERKQIEQEREELLQRERYAREQAEAATHAKDEFIAVVSHELRTPLNAILGYNRMLQKPELLTPAEHAKFTVIVDQSARRQLKLIEDLLDTARFISGKLRLEMQPCNFLWLVKMAVEEARPTAEAKQVTLVTELDETLQPLTGDSERLQQIVWNLLSNALKFTPAGGAVIIRLTQHAAQVQLTVTDTGQGIAPHVLPFIFDRFRQADSSSSRRYGGLGLGLALVKQLTELHGGTITAASAGVGQGATFTLCLPLHSSANNKLQNTLTTTSQALEPPGSAVPSLSASSQLAGVRVLVVDDEPEARELVVLLLQAQGARVTPLASGAAALALLTNAAQETPDVLVSDVGMPEMDGYELLRQVRAQGLRIPAIALTAFGRAEDRLRALTAGFQMHVPKPVEPEELITVLASLTGRLGKDRDD